MDWVTRQDDMVSGFDNLSRVAWLHITRGGAGARTRGLWMLARVMSACGLNCDSIPGIWIHTVLHRVWHGSMQGTIWSPERGLWNRADFHPRDYGPQ